MIFFCSISSIPDRECRAACRSRAAVPFAREAGAFTSASPAVQQVINALNGNLGRVFTVTPEHTNFWAFAAFELCRCVRFDDDNCVDSFRGVGRVEVLRLERFVVGNVERFTARGTESAASERA